MRICTCFYADSEEEESIYPNVAGRASSGQFQAVY